MATFLKQGLGARTVYPSLSYVTQWELEGASQTFTQGSPVEWSSGLLIASTTAIEADTGNKTCGVAVEDGHNSAAARTNLCKFIPAIDGVIFYANVLTGDGADYNLLAADIGDDTDGAGAGALRSKAGLVNSGVTDWFIDAGDDNGVIIVTTKADQTIPNIDNGDRAYTGDTNARVGFVFFQSVNQWRNT